MTSKKRKTTARRKRPPSRRKSRSTRSGLWRPLTGLLVLVLLLLGGYAVYLGKTVRVKFEGKRWAVPAQIYARPLDLYVGATIKPAQLKSELQFLGYLERQQVSAPA